MAHIFKKIIGAPRRVLREFFFDSDGTFNPVYFWTTVCMVLIVITWIMKLNGQQRVPISDYLLLGLLTFVVVWVGLYNKQKKDADTHMPRMQRFGAGPPADDPKVKGQVKDIVEKAGAIEQALIDKLGGKKE